MATDPNVVRTTGTVQADIWYVTHLSERRKLTVAIPDEACLFEGVIVRLSSGQEFWASFIPTDRSGRI